MAQKPTKKVPKKQISNLVGLSDTTAGGQEVNRKTSKDLGGRPTVMTPEVFNKLEQVFAMDGTVEEAIFYSGISRQTYYNYLKENPEYLDRVNDLRQKPVLKARETVIKDLVTPSGAQWYLSRKRKAEFGGGEEFAPKTSGINIYNFFSNENVQREVKVLEDKIKESLKQPKHVESIQKTAQ